MVNSLTDKKNKKIIQIMIYAILVFAVFSDILRVPGSVLTCFRASIPVALMILALFPYWFRRFAIISTGFIVVSVIQYMIFYKVIHPELMPVENNFIKMIFWYECIIIVFFLVKILQIIQGEFFSKEFSQFLIYTGCILLVIRMSNSLLPGIYEGLELDNANNYGSYIAAIFPFLLFKGYEEKKRTSYLLVGLALVTLLICDSKAALLGCVMQVAIFLVVVMTESKKKNPLMWRCYITVGLLIVVGLVLLINPKINGYTLQSIVMNPITRFITNNPYPVYDSSISFRTNTLIFSFWEVVRTGAIGIGVGNTGVLLKSAFPNINPEYTSAINSPTLSLHNAWLEIALDIGFLAIVFYLIVFGYAVKLFFRKINMTQIEKIRLLYILSFPAWVLGPSGIYTMYFLFITMAFLVFVDNTTVFEKKGEKVGKGGI